MVFKKGHTPWNKNKEGYQVPRLKGKIPWNKNKKGCFSKESREKIKNNHWTKKGFKHPMLGKHRTEETKRKVSETKKRLYREGKLVSSRKGEILSEKTKILLRVKAKERFKDKRNHPRYGKIRSKESREKQGQTRQRLFKEGKIKLSSSCFKKGQIHPKEWYEKRVVIKPSEKWYKSMKDRKPWNKGKGDYIAGEKNPNWRDGKSFEPYGLEFNKKLKEQIRKRDGYRCQECFRHQDELYDKSGKKYKLIVHHINFNKQNNNPNNLISLCRNCHLQTNYNRENWIKYFQEKVRGISSHG